MGISKSSIICFCHAQVAISEFAFHEFDMGNIGFIKIAIDKYAVFIFRKGADVFYYEIYIFILFIFCVSHIIYAYLVFLFKIRKLNAKVAPLRAMPIPTKRGEL